jgi:hypothetical protein
MTMNEYNSDDAFNGIINNSGFTANPQATPAQPYTDPHPYGPPAPHHGPPVKTGLTPRGKAALAIAGTLMAGGGLMFWQHHADTVAANAIKAKELQVRQDQIALEQQKALDKTNQAAQKTQTTQEKARQAKVDACVNDNKGLVGKQLGYRMGDVIDDCQKQYPATASTGDMQEAASAQSTGSGGGSTGWLLVGGSAVALVVVVSVKKATRPAPAQHYHHPY